MAGEPGDLVLTMFDDLVDRIKSIRPVRTDGKSLTTGFVYSQLVLGMPVDPRDYRRPWSPMGGSTLQDAVAQYNATEGTAITPAAGSSPTQTASGTPAPVAGSAPAAATDSTSGATNTAPAGPDPKFRRAMQAAFLTSQLVDDMIMVTKDDAYLEYPTARHVSFAYDNIINAMQPTPMPPIAPEVQKQIDEARKVLYELDEEGEIEGKSHLYSIYLTNAQNYAKAKREYAVAQAETLNDPAKADIWPQIAASYQQQVDQTWDIFKTEGAEKVERALDIIESVGVSLQDRMIAKSRKIFDAWGLGLAGVPVPVPYSYISPTNWCDPDENEGWEHLVIESRDYQRHVQRGSQGSSNSSSSSSGSRTSGGGGVSLGFVSLGGSGKNRRSQFSAHSDWQYSAQNSFQNDAKNLKIELWYALCTINRPWLLGDLFYMQDWYLVNYRKNAISDGSIDNQVQKEEPLMPMIPMQFLVVRDLKIHAAASDWHSDGQKIASYLSDSGGSSSSGGGGGGFSIGPIMGFGSHTRRRSESHASSSWESDYDAEYGAHFDGETLEIKGAQIIGWLSEVVPSAPPLDDPGLSNQPTRQ